VGSRAQVYLNLTLIVSAAVSTVQIHRFLIFISSLLLGSPSEVLASLPSFPENVQVSAIDIVLEGNG
jgi:hypothetical protein